MAKLRHRVFEIYEFRDEAGHSLISKSAVADTTPLDSASIQLSTLQVTRESVVTCLQFGAPPDGTPEFATSFRQDLAEVARHLPRGSRVLFDFSNVESLDAASVDAVIQFDKRLQPHGSRMVLCCISSKVQPAFYPDPPSPPTVSEPRQRPSQKENLGRT